MGAVGEVLDAAIGDEGMTDRFLAAHAVPGQHRRREGRCIGVVVVAPAGTRSGANIQAMRQVATTAEKP
ncbi:hypothetical protein D3C85_1910860 [compost metagenome]